MSHGFHGTCRFRVIREQQTKTAPNCQNGKMPTLMSTRSSWMGTDYNMCNMFYLLVKYSSGPATSPIILSHFHPFLESFWLPSLDSTTMGYIGYISFFNAAGLQASLACTDGLIMDSSIISVMSKQTNQPTNQPTKSALLQAIRAALEILGWSLATNIWARKFAKSWAMSRVNVLQHWHDSHCISISLDWTTVDRKKVHQVILGGSFFRI